MNKKTDLNLLIKKLSSLNNQRTKQIFSLVHGKSMVYGMPAEVFRKCGKENCRCSRGEKHGPYPALTVNVNGRQHTIMVKKSDASAIVKKSKRYKYFQHSIASIRKLNREIDSLLVQIRTMTAESYLKN